MGLYNFNAPFEPLILSGVKHYTIRTRRRVEDVPGNMMHLYIGLRTANVRRLAIVPCLRVGLVEIPNRHTMSIDSVQLSIRAMERLACGDGFTRYEEMLEFFEQQMPFEGKIYFWQPLRRVQ